MEILDNDADSVSNSGHEVVVQEHAMLQSQSLLRDEDEMNVEGGGYPNGSVASLQRIGAKTEEPASAKVAREDGVAFSAPNLGTFEEPSRPNMSKSAEEQEYWDDDDVEIEIKIVNLNCLFDEN